MPAADNIAAFPSAEAQLADIAEQMADEQRDKGFLDTAAWQQRYPELASEIARLIPALAALADLSSGGTGILPVSDHGDHRTSPEYDETFSNKTLGDFRLTRELGRGGMGIVYEAEQLSLNRHVALKILPLAAVLDPRTLQRFKNEAQAAAALDHPHIVPVYGVGCERGIHYYVMRLIDGCTLADVIAEHRSRTADMSAIWENEAASRWEGEAASPWEGEAIAAGRHEPRAEPHPRAAGDSTVTPRATNLKSPPDTASLALLSTQPATAKWPFFRAVAELAAHVADGLQHAHEQGVVHRDIKPSNLMLDNQGKIWVTDFGLARVEANPSLTQTGDLLGTLRYMSPEQARGSSLSVDPRSDLYSLGATLYELLTLQPLFDDANRSGLLRKIAEDDPSRPRSHNSQIPGDLETIVLKLIEKEPSRRYASATELALDLRRFIDNKPITARRPTLGQRFAKWSARNRSLVFGGAASAFVITAIVGGIFGWWTRDTLAKKHTAEAVAAGALAAAESWQREDHWPQSLVELQRAEAALAAQDGASQLSNKIATSKRDTEMVIRLDENRLLGAMLAGSDFDFTSADAAYDAAFVDYGIPLTKLTTQEASQRVHDSSIHNQLAAALTDWSIVRKRLDSNSKPDWRHLLSIARQADPDPWRGALRKAWTKNAVLELAEAPALWKQAPSTLFLFVTAAMHQRLNNHDMQKTIRDLERLHPDDFWLNFAAARYFENTDPPQLSEVTRFYSAAASLRPKSAAIHNNLGVALHRLGRRSDAIAEYQRALQLSPAAYFPHANLGVALAESKEFDAALAELRMALQRGAKPSQLRAIVAAVDDPSGKLASLLDELR